MDTFKTIFVALIGGGFVGFVEFLIRRHDSKMDKKSGIVASINSINEQLKKLEEKIDCVNIKAEERETVQARVRILRFADELQEGRKHSKDSYDQCMSDITQYEKYCCGHPAFKNNQTQATVDYIKRNYSERLERRDWL